MAHQTEMVIASGCHFLVLFAVDGGLKPSSVHPQIGPDRTIPSVEFSTCTTSAGGVVHAQHCAPGGCPDSVGGIDCRSLCGGRVFFQAKGAPRSCVKDE